MVKKRKVLTREEEVETFRRYKNGDDEALKVLVLANEGLVRQTAMRYRGFLPDDDLVDLGRIGLLKAIRRFDEGRGFKFSTYAVDWIRQEVRRGIKAISSTIRFPDLVIDRFASLQRELGCNLVECTKSEITVAAEKLGFSPGQIKLVLDFARTRQVFSLQTSTFPEERGTSANLGERIPAPDCLKPFDDVLSKIDVDYLIEHLDPRERHVIVYRFQLGGRDFRTLETLAGELSVTREMVRMIELRALRKMKQFALHQNMRPIE